MFPSRCVVTTLIVFAVSPAAADRGELTERSPYTLEPAEVRIGLTDVGLGLWGNELLERIEVSSHHLVWGGWAFGVPSYDVRAKFEFWRENGLSLSVASEFMRINLLPLVRDDDGSEMPESSPSELTFRVIPVEGWGAYAITDRLRLTAGVVYTNVALRGKTQAGPIDELGGSIGTSSLEWHATAQYRVSKSWHLIGGGRLLGFQKQWAEARVAEMVGEEDEGTASNETRIEGDALGVGGAWTVNFEAHLARKHFNLRFGVEYGNYHVPFVNFVAAQRGFLPTIDMYWRL